MIEALTNHGIFHNIKLLKFIKILDSKPKSENGLLNKRGKNQIDIKRKEDFI